MIELQPDMLAGFPQNGPTDPIEYYKRPLIGRLFRERINRGLRLLPERRFKRVLEVGYGSGAVQVALAPSSAELHGIDLDANPDTVKALLATRGWFPQLRQGNVYELPYEPGFFDLVVSFSTFEHLHEYKRGLAEVYRVLEPGGLFLLGMPSVNRLMEVGFHAFGFGDINHVHVTTPAQVKAAFPGAGFEQVKAAYLDIPPLSPIRARLYHTWLLTKPRSA